MEFVVPIIYPEKPKQVIKVVGNTIFGSLSREYIVKWSQVIYEVVGRLVSHLEKGKPSPISPFLFHLYSKNECLKDEESEIQNPDWRSRMTSESDPFWRIFDDLEQLRLEYHNLDTITTRASKLLGDCKIGNIEKELKKLKAVDTIPLEDKIAILTVILALRNDEIEDLMKQVKSFELLK